MSCEYHRWLYWSLVVCFLLEVMSVFTVSVNKGESFLKHISIIISSNISFLVYTFFMKYLDKQRIGGKRRGQNGKNFLMIMFLNEVRHLEKTPKFD